MENPDINSHIYEYLRFDKEARKKKQVEKKTAFFNEQCWSNWATTSIRMQIDSYLVPYMKFNSKCNKNHKIKPDTLNFIEEKVENIFALICKKGAFVTKHKQHRYKKKQLMKYHEIEKLLYSKDHHHLDKAETYRM